MIVLLNKAVYLYSFFVSSFLNSKKGHENDIKT